MTWLLFIPFLYNVTYLTLTISIQGSQGLIFNKIFRFQLFVIKKVVIKLSWKCSPFLHLLFVLLSFVFLHIFYCFTLVPETDLQFYNRNSHGNTTIFWKKIVQSNREINHFSIYCVKSILHFYINCDPHLWHYLYYKHNGFTENDYFSQEHAWDKKCDSWYMKTKKIENNCHLWTEYFLFLSLSIEI